MPPVEILRILNSKMDDLEVKLNSFVTICALMLLKPETIEEMWGDLEIIDIVCEGFTRACIKTGWNFENKFDLKFIGIITIEVLARARESPDLKSSRQLIGNILETATKYSINYRPSERKRIEKEYKKFQAINDEKDPFVHYETQKIRRSEFSKMDRNPCFLVKISGSNEYVAMDKVKTLKGISDQDNATLDHELVHNGGEDLIFDDIAPVWLMKSKLFNHYSKPISGPAEKSKGPFDPQAEKKEDKNRKTREDKKNKKMMAKEDVQIHPMKGRCTKEETEQRNLIVEEKMEKLMAKKSKKPTEPMERNPIEILIYVVMFALFSHFLLPH